jgi:hypothetical protein
MFETYAGVQAGTRLVDGGERDRPRGPKFANGSVDSPPLEVRNERFYMTQNYMEFRWTRLCTRFRLAESLQKVIKSS